MVDTPLSEDEIERFKRMIDFEADSFDPDDYEWLESFGARLLAERERLKKEIRTLYRKIEAPLEGVPVQYVGCHVLSWKSALEPSVGFVEADDS